MSPGHARLGASEDLTAGAQWIPEACGVDLMIVTVPPSSVMAVPGFDAGAAAAEYAAQLPGLAERFEKSHPGMHRTDTVDFAILLDGEIHLELDDGAMRKLARHDLVVQNGTRHAWRNRGDTPATMLFVLVGLAADRS